MIQIASLSIQERISKAGSGGEETCLSDCLYTKVMNLNIKKATAQDARVVAEILTEAMHYKLKHGDNVWGDQPYAPEEVRKHIAQDVTYLAYENGEPVATFVLTWSDEMVWGDQPPIAGYVHQLAVKDSHRGRGMGRQLLDWAGQKAAEKGRELLRIDVPPFNEGLKRYYEKLGFEWVKNREVHAPHAVYVAALYERAVK